MITTSVRKTMYRVNSLGDALAEFFVFCKKLFLGFPNTFFLHKNPI